MLGLAFVIPTNWKWGLYALGIINWPGCWFSFHFDLGCLVNHRVLLDAWFHFCLLPL